METRPRSGWPAIVLTLGLALIAAAAQADVFRPAYLELRELPGERYDVLWKVPARGNDRLSLYLEFPAGTQRLTEPRVVAVGDTWTERYRVGRTGGLAGETVTLTGSAAGVSDVIVRLERLDGSAQVERLPPDEPRFVVQAPAGRGAVAGSYLALGFEHILGGFDHLLFVLVLLLLVHSPGRIVATVTAFTVAHSFTLAAATLGWVHVPGPPVEAAIALSIVFVAAEVVHGLRGRPGLTARAPWGIAFGFGLLHGLGFAGALTEVGLPATAIPLALLSFNIGVELGQLVFVAAVLVVGLAGRRLLTGLERPATAVAAYAIGSVAAFWTLERVSGFWAWT